ncbi:hypothetical protein [Ferrovibrio xuzhouensis]|uniref:Uncharacterized protein n=1 Tax=Ferrovibrio xuzhouensis TaxID=1576914 RepID=A0ABV7VCA7_9PROT
MEAREFRERFIVTLFRVAHSAGLIKYYDAVMIADKGGLTPLRDQLRLVVDDIAGRGWGKAYPGMSHLNVQITHAGIEAAEDLLQVHPEYKGVPASDRYVALSDNQRNEVAAEVQNLKSAVRAANDVEEKDRQIALSEIAVFEATIVQPQIPVELVERFAQKVLGWILKKFGEALTGAAIKVLVDRLIKIALGVG